MIETMKFVSLAGPKVEIDNLVSSYLSKHDIQLESAIAELDESDKFETYLEENPYKDLLKKSHNLMNLVHHPDRIQKTKLGIKRSEKFINKLDKEVNSLNLKIEQIKKDIDELSNDYNTLDPFKSIDFKLSDFNNLTNFHCLFGRIPRDEFEKFNLYLDEDLNEIFLTTLVDSDYTYGVCFSPTKNYQNILKTLKELHFEEIEIPDKYSRRPDNECLAIVKKQAGLDEQLKDYTKKINAIIEQDKEKLKAASRRIEVAYSNFDVRKLAACTKDSNTSFQILCGWMTEKESKKLQKETEDDIDVVCIINDEVDNHKTIPPTKLRNNRFIRPFELFVKMYGLPSYNEFDPTLFLTMTYAFIFGLMFGDLGQGLLLFFGGMILYKIKKFDLAGIICAAGFFSCIFGTLFGSFFGFEFESFISPLDSKLDLPFLGQINIVLVVAFLFGAFMILVTMIINMATAIKQKNIGKALFGPNALTGFIFYGGVILVVLLFMTGHQVPGTTVLMVMFVVPLVLIFFAEPLKNLIGKKKPLIDDNVGIFGATAFFELFDYLITYLSNSLSFLRIGVFAISHAAMMQVVMSLAGAENDGHASIIVVIIGNVIVLGMEGLVVGIQVLRLEYYEIFGHFYEGTGREFIPYRKNIKH